MPLDLNPQLKARLREGLRPIIEAATVRGRQFLDSTNIVQPLGALNASLPNSIRARLRDYISDEPMYDFVFGQLSQELSTQPYEAQHVGLLTGIAGYEDPTAVASRLVDVFDALPNKYTVTMRLPDAFKEAFEDMETSIEISSGVSVRKGEVLTGAYEAGREVGLMGMFAARDWQPETAYLQVEFDGFIGKYVTTESQAEAVESLYAFIGAAQALGAVRVQRSFVTHPGQWSVLQHARAGGAWFYLESDSVGEPRRVLLSSLVLDDQSGRLAPEHQKAWLRSCLRGSGFLFGAPAKSRSRLLLGCKWLFDSYSGDDELLQYIQATVVVETLLGDKATSDQVGLGALLGNRCAYLIGYSSSQRDDLLEAFKDIYDVRSRIVHRGKSRLSRKEAELFYRLHWICGRIIQREVELLTRDKHP